MITEHELVNSAPYPPATNYERKFRLPVREYVLEVCFDPARLPARCVRYSQLDEADEIAQQVEASGSVHGVALNFGPGRYGVRWDWQK